jgi:hypothetical protein
MEKRGQGILGVIIFLFLTTFTAAGGGGNDDQTIGMKNGRFWNSLTTDSERTLFVLGLRDGWSLRGNTEDTVSGKIILAFHPCNSSMTYGEEVEMISAAYREPENRGLPVGWVLMANSAIHCGKTAGSSVFPALRRHLAEISGKTAAGDELAPIDTILSVSAAKP